MSGSDDEEDKPLNPLATCVLDDGEESFCEYDDECYGLNEIKTYFY